MGKALSEILGGGYVVTGGNVAVTASRAEELVARDRELLTYKEPFRPRAAGNVREKITRLVAENTSVHMELLAVACVRGMGIPKEEASIAIVPTSCLEQRRWIKTKAVGSKQWGEVLYDKAYDSHPGHRSSPTCTLLEVKTEVERLERLRTRPEHTNAMLMARALFNLLGHAPTRIELVQETPLPGDKGPAFKMFYRRREDTGPE